MKKKSNIWRIVLLLPVFVALVQLYPERDQPNLKTNGQYISDIIPLNRSGEIWINVDNKKWPEKDAYDNQVLQVSLIFDTPDKIGESNFTKTPLTFILNSRNNIYDRLIYTNDFDTNRIVLKNLNVFSYEGYARQYKIGLINNFVEEDIHLMMNIEDVDSTLLTAQPRILLEPCESVHLYHPVFVTMGKLLFWIALTTLLIVFLNDLIMIIKGRGEFPKR